MLSRYTRSAHRPLTAVLLFIALIITSVNTSAQKKVLFYGKTHQADGVAAALINSGSGEFFPIGSGSAIWTPGHTSASLDWLRKTTADFAAFDAIVICDT